MKCWFCGKEAVGVCAICGRAICREHAHVMDEMTIAKSDTSTGFASYYKAHKVLKCSECWVEWENWEKGKRILK